MEFLLSGANEKRAKEASIRRDAAKLKLDKERKAKAAQLEREAVYEAERAVRREEEEKRAAEREFAIAEEATLTGGLSFSLQGLRPYRIEGEDDKVILSEDCLQELNQADAFGRGAVILRLWASNFDKDSSMLPQSPRSAAASVTGGTCSVSHYYTHCGIREFSAPSGFIGLPDKVIQSLCARRNEWVSVSVGGGEDAEDLSSHLPILGVLSLKYVTMPKVSYACLQPLRNAFQAVEEVKHCLEQNLRYHTSLSVGDLVTIWHRGAAHQLRVKSMKPNDFGSLLQTDVEVDLDMSAEFLDSQEVPALGQINPTGSKGAVKEGAAATMIVDEPSSAFQGFGATTGGGRTLDSDSGTSSVPVAFAVEKEKDVDINMPDEPASGEEGVVACRLRLSTGATLTRRYRKTDALNAVFELAARQLHVDRSALRLSTSFPTRTIEYDADIAAGQTLEQAELTSSQIMFMVSVQ